MGTTSFKIPNGNYNVYELKYFLSNVKITFVAEGLYNILNGVFSKLSECVDVEYNKNTNKYTFNNSQYLNFKIYIKAQNGGFLGLEDNIYHLIFPTLESTKPINMVAYNKIVMNIQGMEYSGLGIENISSPDGFELSSIFFWASRQDINNMAEIQYNNEDGGNSFNYELHNKMITNLTFQITDENYNIIHDLPDLTMILQFSIKSVASNDLSILLDILEKMKKYLLDIYSMIYLILDKIGILN